MAGLLRSSRSSRQEAMEAMYGRVDPQPRGGQVEVVEQMGSDAEAEPQ